MSSSESDSSSDSGSLYSPSSSYEDDEWYSEALRMEAYSDLDYDDNATDSVTPTSSRDLTDNEEDERGNDPAVIEMSERLRNLATSQASTSSKRLRASSNAHPPASQKRKRRRRDHSPAPTPFSKIVDEMEGNMRKIGKGPWVDRLLHPCVLDRSNYIDDSHSSHSIHFSPNSEMEKELDDYAAQFIDEEDKPEQLAKIRAHRQHVKKCVVAAARNACKFASPPLLVPKKSSSITLRCCECRFQKSYDS